MRRFVFIGIHSALAAILLTPVFCLLNRHFRCKSRSALCCLTAVYLSGVFAVAGLPNIAYIRFDPNINLELFAYMFSDYTSSILNVILFLPLGTLLPLLWGRFRSPLRTVCFGFATSFLVEVLQLFTFRATDVNDLITNTLGTAIGWCLGRLLAHFVTVPGDGTRKSDVYLVFSISFGIMFFFQPLFEALTWRVFA